MKPLISTTLFLLFGSDAFVPKASFHRGGAATTTTTTTELYAAASSKDVSRSDFLKQAASAVATISTTSLFPTVALADGEAPPVAELPAPEAVAEPAPAPAPVPAPAPPPPPPAPVTLKSGVKYVVSKQGDGPKPDIGQLAGIRFKAVCVPTGNVIDDTRNTREPYYSRVGGGGLLKGVEEVLPLMRVGDQFVITIPGNMAFGEKGRPSSAGKPRIPANAEIIFEVEMVGLPGKEADLIDLIGDD